jgi:hypothetical protein
MRIRKVLFLMLLAGLLFLGCKEVLCAQGARRITGTYTNMYYNEEGEDVLGEELKIVVTQGGRYPGACQFAQGEPERLLLVDIEVTADTIRFALPDGDTHAGRFNGTISSGAIQGEFRYANGAVEKLVLKRGKSYWD